MAKQSGLGDNLYIDGIDLSGSVGALGSIGGGPAVLEMTAINQSAFAREGGLRDGRLEFSSFWDTEVAHPTLKGLPTTDRIVTYYRGTALGGQVAGLVAKQINYDPTRGNDGSLLLAIEALANSYGIEWGKSLTAGLDLSTSGVPGAAVDFDASTDFGLQAYLQVQSFTGTSADITIEDSADGSTGWTQIAAFASVTVFGAQRIQTARDATIRQHLRFNISGTFSVCNFALAVVKNDTEVLF